MEVSTTTSQSKKEAQSARTKQRLIEAATRLFCEKGCTGTSVQAIAKAAEISQGSVFWHFGSKDGLLFAVVDAAFAEWERHAVTPLLSEETGPVSAWEVADAHLSFAQRNPEIAGRLFFMLLCDALRSRSELRASYAGIYNRFRRYGTAWIEQAMAAGRCRRDLDPNAGAAVLVGALAGITLQWILDGESVDIARAHQDLARILDRGMAASESDARK